MISIRCTAESAACDSHVPTWRRQTVSMATAAVTVCCERQCRPPIFAVRVSHPPSIVGGGQVQTAQMSEFG